MKRFFQKPHNLAAIAVIILTLIIASAAQNGDDASKAVAPTQSSRNEQGIQETQHTSFENATSATAREEDWKAIRDDALQRAAGYAEVEDYKMAITVLNEALKKLPGDEELSGALDKYQSDNRIIVRTYAISAAKEAADSGNYAEALTALKKAQAEIGEDVEFSALHANYADIYRQQLRDDAKKAYDSNDYQQSLSIIRNGLTVLGSDADLEELASWYKNAAPTSFNAMTYWGWNDETGDMYDTKKELFQDVYMPYGAEDYEVTLNGEYKRACGTLIWNLKAIDYPDLGKPTITFYGDGQKLLEASVSCASGKTDFEVDLTGIIYLKICCYSFHSSYNFEGYYGGIASCYFYKAVTE